MCGKWVWFTIHLCLLWRGLHGVWLGVEKRKGKNHPRESCSALDSKKSWAFDRWRRSHARYRQQFLLHLFYLWPRGAISSVFWRLHWALWWCFFCAASESWFWKQKKIPISLYSSRTIQKYYSLLHDWLSSQQNSTRIYVSSLAKAQRF